MAKPKPVWSPLLLEGMPCRLAAHGFHFLGRIAQVLDQEAGEVLALPDEGQEATATQGETYTLFTPGELVAASWRSGLIEVEVNGRWERPVLHFPEPVSSSPTLLGWQASEAVRCDPTYRHKVTGGGAIGPGGKFIGKGPGGEPVNRKRWTTTLSPEALEVLRQQSEARGIHRNEVVEQLLLAPRQPGAAGGTVAPAPASGPKPADVPPRPEHLRKTLDTHTPYLKSRLLVAAEHLAEAHRIIKQEQHRYGSIWEKENLVFTTHFQEVVAYWNEREIFGDFAATFDDPSIKTFDDVLRHMVQLFKRASQRTEGIRTFTGCKPDHNKAHLSQQS